MEITPESATNPPLSSDVQCDHTAPQQQMPLPMDLNDSNSDRMAHFDLQTGEAMEAEEDTPNDNINDISERPQLIKPRNTQALGRERR